MSERIPGHILFRQSIHEKSGGRIPRGLDIYTWGQSKVEVVPYLPSDPTVEILTLEKQVGGRELMARVEKGKYRDNGRAQVIVVNDFPLSRTHICTHPLDDVAQINPTDRLEDLDIIKTYILDTLNSTSDKVIVKDPWTGEIICGLEDLRSQK